MRSHERGLSDRRELLAAALQTDLQRECRTTARPVVPPLLPLARAQQKLARGVPLLDGELVTPDPVYCFERLRCVTKVLGRRAERTESVEVVVQAAVSGRLALDRALEEVLAGHEDHLAALANWAGVPCDVLAEVLSLVAQPVLESLGDAFRPLVGQTGSWERGYCPICGFWPGLSFVQEAVRYLWCERCGLDWPAPPLQCVYCRNDAPDTITYVAVGTEPGCQIEVCQACMRYLGVVQAIVPGDALDRVEARRLVASIGAFAGEQGYGSPAQPGFRIELGEAHSDEQIEDFLELD